MKTVMKIALGIILACVLLVGGCVALVGGALSGSDTDKNAAERATEDRKAAKGDASSEEPSTKTKTKTEPSLTPGQENAMAKAELYLDTQAFSKSGLVKQLKFEKFAEKDAVFAVNNIEVNWREQAAAKAEQYLETQAFSRDGLIDQLKFEGFTDAEAAYGVKQAGL